MRYVWLCIVALIVTDLVAFFVYAVSPDYRVYFFREDSFIENVTAGIFICVFLIALAQLIHKSTMRRSTSDCWRLAIIGTLGLLAFLDEISFGERLFDLKMPAVAGVKVDAAHDLVELVYSYASGLTITHPVLSYILALCALTLVIIFVLRFGKIIFGAVNKSPIYLLLSFCVFFVLSATLIDAISVEAIGHAVGLRFRHIMAFEEILELNAAITLLLSVMMLAYTTPPRYRVLHEQHQPIAALQAK